MPGPEMLNVLDLPMTSWYGKPEGHDPSVLSRRYDLTEPVKEC